VSAVQVTVVVPNALQHLSDGHKRVDVDVDVTSADGATVASVLTALSNRFPGVYDRTVDERGEIRRHVNVFVDNESIRTGQGLATPVPDGGEIVILPAVSGGCGTSA
jgi:sulfur-carrier protein